jgi:hypothetical protein
MPLEATVQGAPAEIGNGIPQAAQHVVQREQRLLAERHHDGFLSLRPHRGIGRRGPLAPLPHRVQVVASRQEDVLWQAFCIEAPARRRVFEPSFKRRKSAPLPCSAGTMMHHYIPGLHSLGKLILFRISVARIVGGLR